MKARIKPNGFFGGVRTDEWLQQYANVIVNGQKVSDWQLTDVLPDPSIKEPIWNGETWIENLTPEIEQQRENEKKLQEAETARQTKLQAEQIKLVEDKFQAIEDDGEAFANQEIYPLWNNIEEGFMFPLNFKTRDFDANNVLKLYRCIQPIALQKQFPPRLIPAHFIEVFEPSAGNEYEVWSQRTGANASEYSIGKIVWYPEVDTQLWISKINFNDTVPDGDIPFNRYWEPYNP